jgi:putative endonuclease
VGTHNITFGRLGEDRAARWYAEHGYSVLGRNWRCAQGEIDLLCIRGAMLVVCEVKARRTERLGTPVESVTRAKQLRLRRLAAAYLRTEGGSYAEVRFDVAALLGSELTVVEGAF